MPLDPSTAPARDDLPFLSHRGRVRKSADAGSPVSDFVHGGGRRPPHQNHHHDAASDHPSEARQAPAGTDPPSPDPFDMPKARPDTPAPRSSSLDLSEPPAARSPAPDRPRPAPASSLDLSGDPPAPPAGGPVAASRPVAAPDRRRPRVAAGEQRILTITDPTVALTRVQSGVGHLSIEAVCSAEAGDLRLGALYQLRSGASSTVHLAGGAPAAPPGRRPVLTASREEYEQLRLDLRQSRDLVRMAVYVFSESRAGLTPSGTLVLATFGAARVELPLETLASGPTAVLLTLHNVSGELIVRAELETIDGDIRDAARAYGYDRITWRDSRTPVD